MKNVDGEDVPALLRKGVDDVVFACFSRHNLDVDQPWQGCSFQTLQGLQLTGHLEIRLSEDSDLKDDKYGGGES